MNTLVESLKSYLTTALTQSKTDLSPRAERVVAAIKSTTRSGSREHADVIVDYVFNHTQKPSLDLFDELFIGPEVEISSIDKRDYGIVVGYDELQGGEIVRLRTGKYCVLKPVGYEIDFEEYLLASDDTHFMDILFQIAKFKIGILLHVREKNQYGYDSLLVDILSSFQDIPLEEKEIYYQLLVTD